MIQANELRIGNKVFKEGLIVEVDAGLFYWLINQNYPNLKSFSQIEPIPITPEILEKTSLIRTNSLFCSPENVRLKSAKDEGTGYCSFFFNQRLNKWMDAQARITFDYLHQLENYYFFMTGEELKLSL